jgi:hypothetical protein
MACLQDEGASVQTAVVGRLKAERAEALPVRLRSMFDDMHFVYAGAAAAAAALVCLTITLTMFRFATSGSPGSDINPIRIDAGVLMPRPLDGIVPVTFGYDDAVFTLAAVVTRDGRVENLEVLRPVEGELETQPVADGIDEVIESVRSSVSQARFEPARVDGLPVAVNMVWLVAQTTVRGEAQPVVRRGGKKRAATRIAPAAPIAA